jgi:GNAT superfamily N-acetyltransferase
MALASVRRAVDADVDALVRIQSDTWRAAYAELVPVDALARLNGPDARAAWSAAIEAGDGHHVFVAAEGEWIVGFCAAAHRPDEDGATFVEVSTLLVEPRWGRRGHGGRPHATAAEALRENGAQVGWPGCRRPTPCRAPSYGHAGWDAGGAVRGLDTGAGTLREVRLSGPLDLRLRWRSAHRGRPVGSPITSRHVRKIGDRSTDPDTDVASVDHPLITDPAPPAGPVDGDRSAVQPLRAVETRHTAWRDGRLARPGSARGR